MDTQYSKNKISNFTYVKIYNNENDDGVNNYDILLEEDLEVIRKDNIIKIKIPDRYIYNFSEYGCEVDLKGCVIGEICWDQYEGYNPIEEIKVL